MDIYRVPIPPSTPVKTRMWLRGLIDWIDTEFAGIISPGLITQYYRGDDTWQTLDTGVVPENGNLYYTNTRARAAISTTAHGLQYDNTTGIISMAWGHMIPTVTEEADWNWLVTITSFGQTVTVPVAPSPPATTVAGSMVFFSGILTAYTPPS